MATEQDVMRLVAEVVDKFSGPMKQMRRAMSDMADGTKTAHGEAAKAAREHAKHLKELHERFAKVRETAVDLVTPAFAAVGIAGLSATEAIKSLVEQSRKFAETGRMLEMVGNRSGMSAAKIRELDEVAAQAGISVEDMNKGLSEMGEFLDLTSKNMPEALAKWNTMPLALQKIGKAMVGASRDQAAQMAIGFLPKMTDKGQRRQFLALLGLPEDFASFSNKQLAEIFESASKWTVKHPFSAEEAERADAAWRKLGSTFRGIQVDLQNMTAPSITEGVDTIRKFLDDPSTVKGVADEIKTEIDDVKSLYTLLRGSYDLAQKLNPFSKGNTGTPEDKPNVFSPLNWGYDLHQFMMHPSTTIPGAPNADNHWSPAQMLREGMSPVSYTTGSSSGGDAEKMLRLGVKEGVLDALREWMADKSAPGGGGGNGFTNASFEPGGGGGGGPSFRDANGFKVLHGGGGGDGGSVPAGSGPKPGGMKGGKRDVAKIMRDEWKRAGMTDDGIAGLMANVQDESSFNPTLRHPDQPNFSGEAHYAHGLYQEGGAEWNHYAAWLQKNYPGADWRDPRLQSRFAAENLKKNYRKVWDRMKNGTRYQAGAAYVDGYLKPAAAYRNARMSKYLHGGVAPLEAYTGPPEAEQHGHGTASLRDHIRNRGLLKAAKQSGLYDSSSGRPGHMGHASVSVDFTGMPKGVRTKASADGLFKQVTLNRGRAMPLASQDS
jgi:Phage tail lysozyme